MVLIPLWKVRREINRIGERSLAWLGNFYEPLLKRRHDLWRVRQPVPLDLGVQLTPKVAIFLIYQPRGVAPSILCTLRWLVQNGYAPLVVSNAPISGGDRSKLEPLVWRIFERPNFGYDFGGYRDGVLLLDAWGVKVDRVLILNDSVWLPTRATSTLIERLEALDTDLAGGTMHPASLRRSTSLQPRYLESYLFLLSGHAVHSEQFVRYWHRFPASSHKHHAIRKGERRFTSALENMGFTVEGLFSAQKFVDAIAASDDRTLYLSLQYGAYVEADHQAESDSLVAGFGQDPEWRAKVLNFMDRMVRRRRFNAVFPFPCDQLFGMDFLKKSVGSTGDGGKSLHAEMWDKFLKAVQDGALPDILPEVKSEMKSAGMKRPKRSP